MFDWFNGLLNMQRTWLITGALVCALGLVASRVSAAERLFGIAVHITYIDGFEYDGIFAHGVPASQVSEMLQLCGRNHQGGSAVLAHCYVVPE